MAGLGYAGVAATADTGVMTLGDANDLLDTGTTRSYTLARIDALAAPYATTNYVDTVDSTFVAPSAVDSADALNLPLSARGVANGVATLGTETPTPLIPLNQCPNLGVGFFKGPYGVATQLSADAVADAGTPQRQLATIDLGTSGPGIRFKPLCFANALLLQATNARAALEVRIGDASQTTYAAQTLIGAGVGRSFYNDYQSVFTQPCGDSTGQSASTGLAPATHWIVTLWLVSITGTCTVRVGNVTTFSAYLLRTSL